MISLFPRKYKKRCEFFLFTAGDKWNAAKYLIKNRRGNDFVLFKTQLDFHFTDKQELI